MKSLMAMMVLVMVVPAMAVVTFTATGTDDGSGKFTIAYSTTDGDAPRGVALRISCSDGATADVVATNDAKSWDAAFNTFIDWAYSNPLDFGFTEGKQTGHPLALLDGPGALAADASEFSICMGVLDNAGAQAAGPTSTTNLVTVVLKKGTADESTVTITADTLRGPASGVVGSVLESNLTTAPVTCVVKFGVVECVKSTASIYADWVKYGKPACWCYVRQCRGDLDGKSALNKPVTLVDLNTFKLAFNIGDAELALVANGICADLNHAAALNKRVTLVDLNEFKKYFNTLVGSVPECALEPNYNFWVTP